MFRLELRKNWEPTTVGVYLNHFKSFIEFCDAYESRRMDKHFSLSTMQKALRDTRRRYADAMSKARNERAKERFDRVPSLSQVIRRQQQVIDILKKDIEEKTLPLNHVKALNFFLLQVRLNVRSGPLLNLTWEVFDSHLRLGYTYETNEHKTGELFFGF